jgi:hypothetical protein
VPLSIVSGESTYSVTTHVTPPARPRSKKPVFLWGEPFLDVSSAPIRGDTGFTAHLTGTGFPVSSPYSPSPAPQVLFGGVPGTRVVVATDGKSLDVVVPPGTAGSTVEIAVIRADGQASVRANAFVYVPLPTITDLIDVESNFVPGESASGGAALTLVGTGFLAGDVVRFGGNVAVGAVVVDSAHITLTTPPGTVGKSSVTVVDEFGRTATAPFDYEYKDPPAFAASPYSPAYGYAAGGTTITITGTAFESSDRLVFNGSYLGSTFVCPTTRRFTSPAIAAGSYSVKLVDRFGLTASGPNFTVKDPPPIAPPPGPATGDGSIAITVVQATAGPHIGSTKIAANGGASIRVTGTGFLTGDTVTLGGTSATITALTSTQIVFTAPGGDFGTASLVVADGHGNSATSSALTYVGFGDVTATGLPGTSCLDNWTAQAGAIGDLDNDGSKDDLVISTNYATYNGNDALGARTVFTRMLFGQSGSLSDVTASNFPGWSASGDKFTARGVVIGDLDGDSDQDVVIAGQGGYVYVPSPGTSYSFDARIFSNNGTGTFTLSARSPHHRTADVTCTGSGGGTYTVLRPGSSGGGPTALAIGDLDGDGDAEIVMATSWYRTGSVYINPANVTFTPGAYYDAGAASQSLVYGTAYYTSALRIFDNRGTSGFEDVTFPRLPLCGTPPYSVAPCFVADDVKLGDIDGDSSGSLDIVLTWSYPTTTTPLGLVCPYYYYCAPDISRVCTKVLINNGSGFFTDQTSTWMPAASSPEFWQGDRCELVDLDGDGKKDLVILAAQPLDGVTTTTSSLRILHNAGSAFVDVTSTALPSVPLPGTLDDNLRGNALVVRDVDGDGNLDILVGTTEQLVNASACAVRRTRLLLGDGALHFTLANEFLPPTSVDTGDAAGLVIGDLGGNGSASLVLMDWRVPAASTNGERMRRFDWK